MARPEPQRGGVAVREPVDEGLELGNEPVCVGREPCELGKLADEDRDGQAVHVADLDLLREQVGDESELAGTEPDQDQADHHRHHPGERNGGFGVVRHDDERHDGGEDQW